MEKTPRKNNKAKRPRGGPNPLKYFPRDKVLPPPTTSRRNYLFTHGIYAQTRILVCTYLACFPNSQRLNYFFNSPFAHFSRGFGLGLYQWEASTQTYPTSILSPITVPFHVIFPLVGLVVTASN